MLDYGTRDPGSIPGSAGTTDWLVSAGCNLTGYCYQQYRPRLDNRGSNESLTRSEGSAGNKLFYSF